MGCTAVHVQPPPHHHAGGRALSAAGAQIYKGRVYDFWNMFVWLQQVEGLRAFNRLFGPLGVGPLPDEADFVCCAQFVVDRNTIRRSACCAGHVGGAVQASGHTASNFNFNLLCWLCRGGTVQASDNIAATTRQCLPAVCVVDACTSAYSSCRRSRTPCWGCCRWAGCLEEGGGGFEAASDATTS